MRYRLKDAELQRKFDEITNGEFSKNLQHSVGVHNKYHLDVYKVKCGDPISWEDRDDDFSFSEEELKEKIKEEIAKDERNGRLFFCRIDINVRCDEVEPEFDPATWNDWPETQPPSLKSMRVEYKDKNGCLRKTCAQFSDVCSPPCWIDFNGNNIEATELKFRPWED